MDSLDTPASWAPKWCYYFLVIAVIAMLGGVGAIVLSGKLGLPTTLLYLVAATAQAATAMTLFWMCRSSLAGGGISTCR